jgi:ATP phosphoribosyltransferase
MANVPESRLDEVRALMPGISGPTVMPLAGRQGWLAVHAVVDETEVNGVIAMLKGIGGTGILVLPIERMVP